MNITVKKRNMGIDILKFLAIIGVILIHTSSAGFPNPTGSFDWTSSLFYGSISRASVPLFLMCSGALLLNPNKELTLKKLYLHNMLRIVLAMLVYYFVYKLYHMGVSHSFSVQAIVQSIKEILVFNQEFHFYYIHIIILVYAFLPLSRIIVRNASKRELEYVLAVWFVTAILIPTIRTFGRSLLLPVCLFSMP